MTVRIGWAIDEAKPVGVGLFTMLKSDKERTRYVVVGYLRIGAAALDELRREGKAFSARVIGVLRLRKDISAELFEATVQQLDVAGKIITPPHLRDAVDHLRRAG
jgi:hypothetical protein